jgi:predicted transposase/invertase (TIGR01784 family)
MQEYNMQQTHCNTTGSGRHGPALAHAASSTGGWFLAARLSSPLGWITLCAESMQRLSRLGEGLLSKSSKFIQRPFLLQTGTTRLSSKRVPSIIHQPPVPEKRHKMTAAPLSRKIYGIATYDALFKYVLSEDTIRASFFHAFIPDLNIKSSIRLDNHMNPTQELQLLREFVHRKDTVGTINRLNSSPGVLLGVMDQYHSSFVKDEDATIFLHEMLGHFGDIQKSFPKAKYDGTMDFVCELDNDEYAMVEMQVMPENYWDNRALAYVAAFYGNQLRKGGHWKHIRKVIGINILGGGKSDKAHWTDTPGQYARHYKFQEQLHKDAQGRSERYIDGMELIQYSIMNAPHNALLGSEKQDWITFFKRGHRMNEQEVATGIKTPEVLQAFERARLTRLPREVREQYVAEDLEYDRYSDHTNELLRERASEIARKMLVRGRPVEEIVEDSGLTTEEVEALRASSN